MSKVYDIGLQRYRNYEIIVWGKNSIPLKDETFNENKKNLTFTELLKKKPNEINESYETNQRTNDIQTK